MLLPNGLPAEKASEQPERPCAGRRVLLFLAGDVMVGRGIDQILPNPCDPELHEEGMPSALDYVALAERANGPTQKPVGFSYVWGDALDELRRRKPDVGIVNLETAVTRHPGYLPKGINYRISPENFRCISAAGIGCCVLANNHVLDFCLEGLVETLETIASSGIQAAGAGRDITEAAAPAILPVAGGSRVVVFGFGAMSSGIPQDWGATSERPGLNLLPDLSMQTVETISRLVRGVKRMGDIVVASIHWGPNWGYGVSPAQRTFAHGLIDQAAVDIVHGHSSHHPKAIEVYRDRPILYGCGDFLNDYEGIEGYENYRDDLTLMYLPAIDVDRGTLVGLTMIPFRIRNFRLGRASPADAAWLGAVLDREGDRFGTRIHVEEDHTLSLAWD